MTDNVTEALRLVSLLQAELVRMSERNRVLAVAAAEAEAHSRALVEQITAERDRLLERLGRG
jgi:hypothetical protein